MAERKPRPGPEVDDDDYAEEDSWKEDLDDDEDDEDLDEDEADEDENEDKDD